MNRKVITSSLKTPYFFRVLLEVFKHRNNYASPLLVVFFLADMNGIRTYDTKIVLFLVGVHQHGLYSTYVSVCTNVY